MIVVLSQVRAIKHILLCSVIMYRRTKHELMVNAFKNNLEYVSQLVTKFKMHVRGPLTI